MKTITITEELYIKLKDELEAKKTVTIYKLDGSVLFESTKETMGEAVLEKYVLDKDLIGANLFGADLRNADLRNVDLSGADLIRADLIGANLSDANLSDADLSNADLSGADLHGANLSGAELQKVKFYGRGGTCKLTKEQLPDFLAALGFISED